MNSKNYVGEQGQPLFKTISILCSGARFVPLLGSEVLQRYWSENGSYQGRRSLAENISRHWYGCQWERVVDLEWIQWHWQGMLSIKVKRFIEWKFHIRKMFGLMQRVTQWPGKPIGPLKNPRIKPRTKTAELWNQRLESLTTNLLRCSAVPLPTLCANLSRGSGWN